MRLLLVACLAVLLSACAAKPPARVPTSNYMIPEYLKDTDALCIPWNGGAICKRVKDVRAFLYAMEAD